MGSPADAVLRSRVTMSRRIRWLLDVFLTLGGLACFCGLNYCCRVTTTYCAVTDPADSWGGVTDRFTTQHAVALSVPEYRVRDGKLYLLVQVTRPSQLL